MTERQGKSRPKGKVKKTTRKSLENIAVYYLGRYDAPARHLKRILMRRVDKSARVHEIDRDEAETWVDEVVEKLVGQGYVDDARYARNRARNLLGNGKSQRAIEADLRGRGLDRDIVDTAMAAVIEVDKYEADLSAAWRLARRRRIGPYRLEGRDTRRDKDMGILARAGFNYSIARSVIDADSTDLDE